MNMELLVLISYSNFKDQFLLLNLYYKYDIKKNLQWNINDCKFHFQFHNLLWRIFVSRIILFFQQMLVIGAWNQKNI